ncbi:RAMP superfamily CRISPR-associated protein [Scytonema sp. NUACC26]|uniref:RAMP superfamily CRISPR-associated protein n=1 Tax=Scytonema sp. NUACC26 TaxID=3140176 RepID=UPI0034DBDB80
MSHERLNRQQRHITERIIIKGTLVMDTPTCLGNGDADGPTDLMLLRDSISSKALLTGASIAGALRNYVHEYEHGYGQDEGVNSLATGLFGGRRKDEDGAQSPLIIHDAISSEVPKVELRDGVRIDITTGTAADKAKYDLELLAAGTEFPLCFELLIEKEQDKNRLLEALTIALQGLENYEIGIGMKKRRGFGCCHVKKWQIWHFHLKNAKERLAWLTLDREWSQHIQPPAAGKITEIFNITLRSDRRCRFWIEATFKLLGSLLIRSGQASTKPVPDVVHLKSLREDKEEPILSATSLTGVLRHRAEKIVYTFGNYKKIINDIFGMVDEESKEALSSRLIVHESIIKSTTELVQNRIAIDRFTGGAYHGALFDEQPIFGNEDTQITIYLELHQPSDSEIGLLLLLLKDLWTSDLSVGGESSIGRGRLQGIKAEMRRYTPDIGKETWEISQDGNNLKISKAQMLESFVNNFIKEIKL